ncbi:MAG: AAA family ATPase, partial [Spirochaetia bacterium]|nr:AAA family ATPase [Spirochaetia bacterium]
MKVQIKKATRKGLWLKMALMGPTGSGKTYSALAIASGLGSRICVLDTERGSASLYSDKFDFSVVDDLPDYHPQNYIDVMKAVVAEGFD